MYKLDWVAPTNQINVVQTHFILYYTGIGGSKVQVAISKSKEAAYALLVTAL